jgi:hypothetical protein
LARPRATAGRARRPSLTLSPARQVSEDLDGLVVGQAAAEADLLEEKRSQPRPSSWYGRSWPRKPRGAGRPTVAWACSRRRSAWKVGSIRAVASRSRRASSSGGLGTWKADGAVPLAAEPGIEPEAGEPGLGDGADGAVAEPDEALAVAQGAEEGRQLAGRPVEVELGRDAEPVDARADAQAGLAAAPHPGAAGADQGAGVEQAADDCRVVGRGDLAVGFLLSTCCRPRRYRAARRPSPPEIGRADCDRGALRHRIGINRGR